MRVLVLIALAGFLAPSWATNTNTQMSMAQIAARSVEAKYGRTDQVWRDWSPSLTPSVVTTTPAGSVLATTRLKGPSPIVGEIIDIDVKRKLPWASISKAVAKSLPLISTAVAIAEIAEAIRCREKLGGGSECDEGTAEVEVSADKFRVSPGAPLESTPAAACATYGAAFAVSSEPSYKRTEMVTSITGTPADMGTLRCNMAYKEAMQTSMGNCGSPWGTPGYTCPVNGSNSVSMTKVTAPSLQCPSVAMPGGGMLVPVKGIDGKCPTMIYEPASEQDVSDKAETHGDRSKAPAIVGDLLEAGKPIEHPFPEIDPVPGSINGPRETTTHPDGSTTTRDTRYDLMPKPNGYEWVPATITKDWPAGVTPTPPGEVTDGTTTTGGAPKEREIITCGLPDTPACKIDEGGTPPPDDPFEQNPGSWFDPIRGVFANPEVADTSWSFTFQLPTGCQVLTVGPFLTQTVTVDLCQYQPMIHDFMSIVWLMTGVWVCIGMVGRTLGGA